MPARPSHVAASPLPTPPPRLLFSPPSAFSFLISAFQSPPRAFVPPCLGASVPHPDHLDHLANTVRYFRLFGGRGRRTGMVPGSLGVVGWVMGVKSAHAAALAESGATVGPADYWASFLRALRRRSSSRSRPRRASTSSMPWGMLVPRMTPASMLYS